MTSLTEFTALINRGADFSTTPIWVDGAHKEPAKFKEWWDKHLPVVEEFNKYRIWNEWNNLLWYTGDIVDYVLGYRQFDNFTGFRERAQKTMPFWVSTVSDLMDKRSNDLSSLKPNFEIIPPEDNATEKTRMSSRLSKPILNHIRLFNRLDMLFDENERVNCLYGKSFITIEWNGKIGDRVIPEKAKDAKKEVDWEGEVEIKSQFPWFFLSWPSRTAFSGPCAIQIKEIIHKEELKKKYGLKKIPEFKQADLFSFSSPFDSFIAPDELVVYRVVYTPDQYLPEGAIIECLHDGTILQSFTEKYPYSHGGFPWEMHDDVRVMGRVFPYSMMNYLKPLQWTYNVIGGQIKKSIYLCSSPKWMMVKGSCNVQSLGNGITVVQHKPGQQPNLAQYNTVGADTFGFRNDIKDEMRKLAGSFGLSSGEVPPNTRSGIQISRYQSIEKQQRAHQTGKRNDLMFRVLLKSLSVAADRYPSTSEENLERILGKILAAEIGVLTETRVSTQTKLTIKNSAGFSDDLPGRLEEIAFTREKLPGLLTLQEEADVVGLRSSVKQYDIATAALRQAEAEFESISDGRKIPAPVKEHDHIVHWQEHVRYMQTKTFLQLPKKMQDQMRDHLGTHEMYMEEIGNGPAGVMYKQRLATLERWPLVFSLNEDLDAIQAEQQAEKEQAMMEQQMAMGQPVPSENGTPGPIPGVEEPVQ